MDEEANNEIQLEAQGFLSPLRVMATESHEIYLELKAVGFPDPMIAQILAHMVSEAVFYRSEYDSDEEDDDDDYDEDEDDLLDGGDS